MDLGEIDKSKPVKILKEILKSLKSYLNVPVAIGISSAYEDVKEVNTSFKEAQRAIKYRTLLGDIVNFDDIEVSLEKVYNVPFCTEKKLVNNIMLGDPAGIPQIVDELFEELKIARVNYEGYILGLGDVISLIRRSLAEAGYDSLESVQDIKEFLESAERYSLFELQNMTANLLKNLAKEISKINLGRGKALITQIRQYIDENYSEQLTLNTISDKFYIHSSYFSRLFKKETSENFIDYLTGKRIEEAKKLLLGTDLKIYEISERVGYGNSKYFSQLFEKHVGKGPKEYRELKGRS